MTAGCRSRPRVATDSLSTRPRLAESLSPVSRVTRFRRGHSRVSSNRPAGWTNIGGFMRRYAIVVEDAGTNFAAYVPDLPGCVATGDTPNEVARLIREAIELH